MKGVDTVIRFFSLNRWPGGSMRFLRSVMGTFGLSGFHLRSPFKPLPMSTMTSWPHGSNMTASGP
jgi:hypothetical protein